MISYSIRAVVAVAFLSFGLLSSQAAPSRPKLNTVTIDPGHGGKDPGCVSRDKAQTAEKDVVLDIALRLRDKIKEGYPDVKVVMTRSTDEFIELRQRAEIANKNNSNLFISIHVNSVEPPKGKLWHSASGFSIHCLGKSRTGADLQSLNMDICRRENAVILMEDDYTESYQGFDPNDPESYIFFSLMQNANLGQSLRFADLVNVEMTKGPLSKSRGISQDPFLVLWRTSMPAVLVECGFMTNQADVAVLRSKSGRDGIASDLCKAFGEFKAQYEGAEASSGGGASSVPSAATRAVAGSGPAASSGASGDGGAGTSGANATASGGVASSNEATAGASGLSSTVYGVQVLASSKDMAASDPFFKGHKVLALKSGGLFRYVIVVSEGEEPSSAEFSTVIGEFTGSWAVIVRDGKITRM